jgi:hypothetical protein
MIIASTTGYIIEAEGPFLSNGRNSDAHILGSVFSHAKTAEQSLGGWLGSGSKIILDRYVT